MKGYRGASGDRNISQRVRVHTLCAPRGERPTWRFMGRGDTLCAVAGSTMQGYDGRG